MKLDRETALVESVLFLETEAIDIASIARILALSENAVEVAMDNLQAHYKEEYHGVEILKIGNAFQLVPKRELWNSLKTKYGKRNENRLSRAALETLSIIAYSQPITRAEIDAIRGVASDGTIKLLVARELIHEVGKKDAPGRPGQFGTTRQFLKLFRLSSIADLPKLDDLEKERFKLD